MATKYAEWIVLSCGLCRWHQDIGSIIDKDMDPTCEIHQEFECVVCGETTDGSSKGHGVLGRVKIHVPVRP